MVHINKGNIKTTIQLVPIEKINFDDKTFRFRIDISEEELTTLKNSILRLGLQNPVKLRKTVSGYQILSGWSRLRALRELGRTFVKAEIYEDIPDFLALFIASSDNLHRSNLSDVEVADQVYAFHEEYSMPVKLIASWMGVKLQRVYDLLRLHGMEERVRNAVHEGVLSMYAAVELYKFPESVRGEFIGRAISEHWSVRMVKEERKRYQHPYDDAPPEGSMFATKGLFHALRYVRYPEAEDMKRGAWETIYKRMGVPGPHKCEMTITIEALKRVPPFVCNKDIEWVVVARGRVDPCGSDEDDPGDDIQSWPAWLFLCDECVRRIFPAVEFHPDLSFIIPLKNYLR